MAHGQPDFGMYAPKTTVYGISDMAELAERLGAINSVDRSGDIIFSDDFESGIARWNFGQGASGGSLVSSPAHAKSGGFSAALSTGTTPNQWSHMSITLPYPVLSKIGFELSFTYTSMIEEYLFRYYIRNATTTYNCRIRFTTSTGLLEIYSGGGWNTLDDALNPHSANHMFHVIKIVSDFETTQNYDRLIFDDSSYGLSAYAIQTQAVGGSKFLIALLQITSIYGTSQTTYVDNAIITQNEP